MVTGKTDLNVVSDNEDRGPLVEDEDFAAAKASVEEKVAEMGDSPEDVLAFLEADDDEEQEEEYYDSRVPLARDTRPLIAAWHEYKNGMSQVKTNYKLWKIEANELGGDDQRRESIVQTAARLKKALNVIEKDLKESLPKLKGAAFLTRSEVILLPNWMHEALGLKIEVGAAERAEAEIALQEKLNGAANTE